MNEQMGLGAMAPQQQAQQMPSVEEVAQMLIEGVDPQALVDAGVPAELIEAAIAMIQQQVQAKQQSQEGLAGMATPQTPLMER